MATGGACCWKKAWEKAAKRRSGGCPVPNRTDFSERPAIVEEKSRAGDWEADAIVGAKHRGAIVSAVDRAAKFTILVRADGGTADERRRRAWAIRTFRRLRPSPTTARSSRGTRRWRRSSARRASE